MNNKKRNKFNLKCFMCDFCKECCTNNFIKLNKFDGTPQSVPLLINFYCEFYLR